MTINSKEPNDIDVIIISEEEADIRIDMVLAKRFPHLSRTYFQKLIEKAYILVNGRAIKKREKPKCGDEVEINFVFNEEVSLQAEDIPLDIIYEDDQIIVINKRAGMVVHPALGHPSGTLVNALLFHCNHIQSNDKIRPGIVHRLDRGTSGILIAAKTSIAQQDLLDQFASREVIKNYLAICIGNPNISNIVTCICRDSNNRKKKWSLAIKVKKLLHHVVSIAHNEEIQCCRKYILKQEELIKYVFHLSHTGFPVLGDDVYGYSYMN